MQHAPTMFPRFWIATPRPFVIFFTCWIAFGIGTWIFYSKASYETKKAWHPFIGIGAGAVFLGFAEWITRWSVPWFFIVAVFLICLLNLRNTQFCPQCNATLYTRAFMRPSFCWKCGAELKQ